eukprot:403337327
MLLRNKVSNQTSTSPKTKIARSRSRDYSNAQRRAKCQQSNCQVESKISPSPDYSRHHRSPAKKLKQPKVAASDQKTSNRCASPVQRGQKNAHQGIDQSAQISLRGRPRSQSKNKQASNSTVRQVRATTKSQKVMTPNSHTQKKPTSKIQMTSRDRVKQQFANYSPNCYTRVSKVPAIDDRQNSYSHMNSPTRAMTRKSSPRKTRQSTLQSKLLTQLQSRETSRRISKPQTRLTKSKGISKKAQKVTKTPCKTKPQKVSVPISKNSKQIKKTKQVKQIVQKRAASTKVKKVSFTKQKAMTPGRPTTQRKASKKPTQPVQPKSPSRTQKKMPENLAQKTESKSNSRVIVQNQRKASMTPQQKPTIQPQRQTSPTSTVPKPRNTSKVYMKTRTQKAEIHETLSQSLNTNLKKVTSPVPQRTAVQEFRSRKSSEEILWPTVTQQDATKQIKIRSIDQTKPLRSVQTSRSASPKNVQQNQVLQDQQATKTQNEILKSNLRTCVRSPFKEKYPVYEKGMSSIHQNCSASRNATRSLIGSSLGSQRVSNEEVCSQTQSRMLALINSKEQQQQLQDCSQSHVTNNNTAINIASNMKNNRVSQLLGRSSSAMNNNPMISSVNSSISPYRQNFPVPNSFTKSKQSTSPSFMFNTRRIQDKVQQIKEAQRDQAPSQSMKFVTRSSQQQDYSKQKQSQQGYLDQQRNLDQQVQLSSKKCDPKTPLSKNVNQSTPCRNENTTTKKKDSLRINYDEYDDASQDLPRYCKGIDEQEDQQMSQDEQNSDLDLRVDNCARSILQEQTQENGKILQNDEHENQQDDAMEEDEEETIVEDIPIFDRVIRRVYVVPRSSSNKK